MAKHVRNYLRVNLYLIRHAESEFNTSGIIQGHLDIDLSQNGIEQAKALGKYLKNSKFHYVFTSDLQRAYNTAYHVVSANDHKSNLKFIKNNLLRERNFGEAQGKEKSFIIQEALKSKIKIEHYVPKGAETHMDLRERWHRFLNDLRTQLIEHETREEIEILIFTHGAFMREAIRHFLNEFNCDFPYDLDMLNISPPNTSISKFLIEIDLEQNDDIRDFFRFIKCEYLFEKNHLISISETLCDL